MPSGLRRIVRRAANCVLVGCLAAALGAGVPGAGGDALASDEAGFKAIESQWKKLAKNHDDAATRERRKLLLQTFDFRDLKTCRKFLRDAWAEENTSDNRIAVVQVLAATGDPKDVEFLLNAFKKEKSAGPQIALALGLSFTDASQAAAMSAWAGGQVAKLRGEPQRAVVEGLGAIGDPSAYAPLLALGDKLDKAVAFERLIALGACGREQAVETLDRARLSADPEMRLGAALGLAHTGGADQAPLAAALDALTALVGDADPRVVEAAADALAKTKHAPAVKPLAEALRTAPLRQREALRAALKAITGRDAGHEADLWLKEGGTAPAPKLPTFAGMSVPTDHAAVLLDQSRSMDWLGRLAKAQSVLSDFVVALPDDAQFGVLAVGRTPVPMSEKLASGGSVKAAADEWLRKQLTVYGCDVRQGMQHVFRTWPSVDTIVFATDSAPFGATAEETPVEVIQELRRDNRMRRVRIFVAMTTPGGRFIQSETDADEYDDRKDLLKQLAESTGAQFKAIE